MESAVLFIFSTRRSGTMKHSSRHFGEQCLYLPALHLCNSTGQVLRHETILWPAHLHSCFYNWNNWRKQNLLQNSFTQCVISGSTAVWRRPSFFWDVKQRKSLVSRRRFGIAYWVSFSREDLTRNLPLKIGLDRFSRNVGDYQSTLSNTPEEQRTPHR